jgi:hypothetical protein
MHVENGLVEFRTADDQEYEEIVEEYEEEIFMPEEFQEPPVTDASDLALAQGKPRCIIRIFFIIIIYICGAFTWQGIYILVALLRFAGSVGNLSLLTIVDYYYYYHKTKSEMVERNW